MKFRIHGDDGQARVHGRINHLRRVKHISAALNHEVASFCQFLGGADEEFVRDAFHRKRRSPGQDGADPVVTAGAGRGDEATGDEASAGNADAEREGEVSHASAIGPELASAW